MNVIFAESANQELERVRSEYAAISNRLADQLADEIEYLGHIIENFPTSGTRFKRKFRLYYLKKFPYVLVGELFGDRVLIHTFVHTKRHPNTRIRRKK